MKKTKNILTLALSGLFLAGFLLASLLLPDKTDSLSERRKLAQRPALRLSALADGTYMTAVEKYALDQFPLRDGVRTVKAFFARNILGERDNDGVYFADGHLSRLDYTTNTDLIRHAAERFSAVYEAYFASGDARVYYSVVPDKNYFLAAENGYPAMDYALLAETLREGMPFAEYADIFDTLTVDRYYRTDAHWRQEELAETASALAAAMGVSLPEEYETVDTPAAFRGVYAGQYALPVEPDTLSYVTNDTIRSLRVYDYETASEIPVYDLTLAAGRDGYEMFLGGTKALLRIENPQAETDRELVIFRDSFGSSIAPLLAQGYAGVTVVDIRYMASALVGQLVDITAADDVLFLYSTSVLNHSETIK